ncbi:MAG: membrane protein insertase YidC [Clostridiales bacterium]|jgi:YidC/Oxa1 family membrane protein insertase|nr:membrane protein insertase YidC [Clostridiales bacterium]
MKLEKKRKARFFALLFIVALLMFTLSACNSQALIEDGGMRADEPGNIIARFLIILDEAIGSFGWTVVVFTLILKTALSPLDFWQKNVMRKNAQAMKRMQPKLEKLQKQYANNREMLQQKQMALYKEEGYKMIGACLPMIVTLVIFIVIFQGFNKMVNYQNAQAYVNANIVFSAVVDPYGQAAYDETVRVAGEDAYNAKIEEIYKTYYDASFDATAGSGKTEEERKAIADEYAKGISENEDSKQKAEAAKTAGMTAAETLQRAATASTTAKNDPAVVKAGQDAVKENYKLDGWLWIHNVFMPDSWKETIPKYDTFAGSGLGKLNVGGDVNPDRYNLVMGGLLGTEGYGKNGEWNGLLILPLLSIVLSFLTQKLTGTQQQPPMPTGNGESGAGATAAMGANMKMMQYIMPLVFGVFSLLYSTAFTIYMFVSSLFGVVFQLTYNLIAKRLDKKDEEKRLSNTFK